jgi:hypothetical protein
MPVRCVRSSQRPVMMRAEKNNGDKKSNKDEVQQEKVRNAVDKLRADGVNDKVARRVCFESFGLEWCFLWSDGTCTA